MNQDIIERYLYAATKRMPRKQRDDVSQELRGLIDDMLSEHCGGLTPAGFGGYFDPIVQYEK